MNTYNIDITNKIYTVYNGNSYMRLYRDDDHIYSNINDTYCMDSDDIIKDKIYIQRLTKELLKINGYIK